tara:strand:+ start:1358 stop:1525 length:168 start_codon:yes stop_codon:yes gene_type:complete
MNNLQSSIFLIKNGYIKTKYINGIFAAKLTTKGKRALKANIMMQLLLNDIEGLSK